MNDVCSKICKICMDGIDSHILITTVQVSSHRPYLAVAGFKLVNLLVCAVAAVSCVVKKSEEPFFFSSSQEDQLQIVAIA